jgi:N4-gp56 family major capsid protein
MALTQISSLNLNITGWEKLAYFALRPELYFDDLCDVDSTNATSRGATIGFQLTSDMAAATTPLTETSDVTPVALADSTVTVTLAEYGNAVQTTAKLRATTFMPVNPIVANVIGFNAGISIDTVAQTTFAGGTNKLIAGGGAARTNIGTSNNLTAALVRQAVAKLRGANVQTFGGQYAALIHPDVSYDFRGQALGNAWADPHVYNDPSGIYNGVIGSYGGARFMETPRAPLFVDASNGAGSTGTIDVYGTLVLGRQAVAKGFSTGDAYGANPVLVDVPVVDALRRFEGMGWKHLVGYSVFRQASLYRIEASSSIGAN